LWEGGLTFQQYRFTDNLLTQAAIDTIGGIAGALGGIPGGEEV